MNGYLIKWKQREKYTIYRKRRLKCFLMICIMPIFDAVHEMMREVSPTEHPEIYG